MVVMPKPPLDLAQLRAHALAQHRVEIRERLVEQQDRRLDDQRARQRDALALSAGQLVGKPLLDAGQTDDVEHRAARASAISALGDLAHPQAEATLSKMVLCGNSA